MNDELTPDSPTPAPDEPLTQPSELSGPETAPPSMFGPPGAGGMIRAARQAQGMDLASLAAMLKIPLRRLEALEQGRHAELQGATFERALAQAACRVLKIDPKPVLALLPQTERDTLERVSEGINTPFRERQGGATLGDVSVVFRPIVLFPVLLVLAAIALFFVPSGLVPHFARPVLASLSSDAPADAASASGTGATTTTIVASGPAAGDAGAVPAASEPATTAAGTAPAAATTPAAEAAPSGVDEVLAHSEASPTIPLQVMATADSWVEVVDAQGHSLLSRTVVAGESVGLDGALPMRVKIGNARGTRLTLRGDNVDLAPWTRDNVARVELK
jgi:cytoskeleton protein RodZ